MLIDTNRSPLSQKDILFRESWQKMRFYDMHTPDRLAKRESDFQERLEALIYTWNHRFNTLESLSLRDIYVGPSKPCPKVSAADTGLTKNKQGNKANI